MSDHAQEVRSLLIDARVLCDSLGWSAKAKPNGSGLLIRCPSHKDSDPSCGITKGPDGTLRAKCHACGWSADALGMIALAHSLNPSTASDFREILAIGAQIGGDLRLEQEIRDGHVNRELPPRKPVPTPEPGPERDYPPANEVAELWNLSVAPASDEDAKACLESRSICPIAAAERGLGHVLVGGQPLPGWAGFETGSEGNRVHRSWVQSGHRLIVRAWDAAGRCRAVRAWQLYGGQGPKRLPPGGGHRHAGLVQANDHAVKMLQGQAPAGRVLICEGEPDWMTWSTRVGPTVAVFGIGSGSWTKEHARRIPNGSEVLLMTHRDPAGEKYAAAVAETLSDKVQVWRLDTEQGIDENDKAKRGTLPNDPRTGCIPANDLARKTAEEEPRFFTVVEMLKSAHKRLVSNEPALCWTSGHWKVDVMTGGLRPETGWVIGAASSWGKSSLGIAIADENLRNWRNPATVLVVSCEDSEDTYADRLLARRARVNALRLRDRRLRADEHQRVCEVLEKAEPKPFFLDGRGVTFERLLRQIDRMLLEHGVDIVMLDYIQETRTKQKYESERIMFREIARTFRHLVKRRGKCSVIMTQLTNADPTKAPTKDNIRECKDIGHGAEVIALGWEPAADLTSGNETYSAGSKLLLIDKSKSGRRGTCEMSWDNVSSCFNRVLRPAGQGEAEREWYDQEGDIEQAISAIDGFGEE